MPMAAVIHEKGGARGAALGIHRRAGAGCRRGAAAQRGGRAQLRRYLSPPRYPAPLAGAAVAGGARLRGRRPRRGGRPPVSAAFRRETGSPTRCRPTAPTARVRNYPRRESPSRCRLPSINLDDRNPRCRDAQGSHRTIPRAANVPRGARRRGARPRSPRGATGLLLCQWAKHLGATVIGTVSSAAKAEQARAAGAAHVVIHGEGGFRRHRPRGDERRGLRRGLRIHRQGHVPAARSTACARSAMMASYGHASGPPDPVDVIELGARGSLFPHPPCDHALPRHARRPGAQRRRAFRRPRAGGRAARREPRLPARRRPPRRTRALEGERETTGATVFSALDVRRHLYGITLGGRPSITLVRQTSRRSSVETTEPGTDTPMELQDR